MESQKVKELIHSILAEKSQKVIFRKNGVLYPIAVYRIIFIEAANRSLLLHMIDGIFTLSYVSLKEVEEKINSSKFIRCHKSFIVNCDYIQYIDSTNSKIKLKHCDTIIDIGRKYKSDVLEIVEYFS